MKDLSISNDQYEVFVGVFPKYNSLLKQEFISMFNKAIEYTNTLISDPFYTVNPDKYFTAIASGSQLVSYVMNKTTNKIESIAIFSVQPIPFNLDTDPVIQCNTVYGEVTKSVDINFDAIGEYARLNNIPRVIFTTPRKGFLRRFDSSYINSGNLYRLMLNQSFYDTQEYSNFKQEFNLK